MDVLPNSWRDKWRLKFGAKCSFTMMSSLIRILLQTEIHNFKKVHF
jgi:hypothetical protein